MIADLLANKTPHERAQIKSQEIAKLDFKGKRLEPTYGIEIDILSINAIDGGVEVFARAWKGGQQLGFGKDGTVDIERFRIFNPPILVPDGTKKKVKDSFGVEIERDNFVENATEALRQSLSHTITLVGKDSGNIVAGKRGNTTDTFYPSGGALPDDSMWGSDATYATARSKATADGSRNSTDLISQTTLTGGTYYIEVVFTNFDTSAIPDTNAVSSATYSLWAISHAGDGNFNVGVYDSTASDSLTTADFDQRGSTAQSDTIKVLADITNAQYNDWTLNTAGKASINKTGVTKFSVRSKYYDVDANAPGGTNSINWASSQTSGTTNDPKLVVVHTASSIAYTTSAVNTVSLSHLFSRIWSANVSKSHTISLSDLSSRLTSYGVAAQGTISLADLNTGLKGYFLSITNQIALSNDEDITLGLGVVATNTVRLSDLVAMIKGFNVVVLNTLNLSNTTTQALQFSALVTNTIHLSDVSAKTGWHFLDKTTGVWTFRDKRNF